ncbi:MAG: phenylalanine--tRNA ligase subunit beta [Gammaproteobacteria bacterium]|nr:phenylalanine--tRNA ligase subunit beta [Gammaproteobacteria bacterium]
MKFSEQWLREWVNPALSRAELAQQLTLAGLEVDAIHPAAAAFSGVVVGALLKVEPHPQATKLKVCAVNVGREQSVIIVTGAANARAGLRVPVALAGAVLADGRTIQPATLRGVESHGMLCSAQELGMGGVAPDVLSPATLGLPWPSEAQGLLELPPEAKPGDDVYSYLKLDDAIFELGLTPNRGDCLSIAGLAREVALLNRLKIQPPPTKAVFNLTGDRFEVEMQAPADCPRYLGRVIRGLRPRAKAPLWMQERLRRSGVRSVSAAVDVTNYVMLEWGQPMHAFDLARLYGRIVVRRAQQGEQLTLLDGKQVTLDAETLVIADGEKAQAIAGIMGGQEAAIGPESDAVFLECAFFNPALIARRARALGLHSDSSHRFERGVDPHLQRRVMERATALLLEIAGGEAGPVIEAVFAEHLPKHAPIKLRRERIERVLGAALEREQVTEILNGLEMDVNPQVDGWLVTPPAHRFDIGIEPDLIEELARIHGYARLPAQHPQASLTARAPSEGRVPLMRMHDLLVARGYQEVITYSFVSTALQRLLDPGHSPLELANPLSTDMSVMRSTLWCGLIQALIYNQNRQQNRLRFFESGVKFTRQGNEIVQEKVIAGMVTGAPCPPQWGIEGREADFYDLKGDVEALLGLTGSSFTFEAAPHPALHPGQSAEVRRNGETAGWIGALHPKVQRSLELKQRVFMFEMRLAALEQGRLAQFGDLSKFPSIRRDLAVVVEQRISAATVRECIMSACPALLQDIELFDVYKGKGIDSGKKSLALGLTLQDATRTLTDQDVNAIMEGIVKKLRDELGAGLRE